MLTRRMFIAGAAAAPLFSPVAARAVASVEVGGGALTTVSDGHLVLPNSFMFGHLPPEQVAPYIESLGLPTDRQTPECNVTLYRDGENTVLFDAGSGADFMPSAGKLLENLDAIGVAQEDVTHVVFTHAHPDHIWGVLDDFGDPAFSEATYMMGRVEWDFWWDPETVNAFPESGQASAVGAKRRMEAIEDVVELFHDGEEILPGVAAHATFGHTPGHMSFEIGGGDGVIIAGDAIGNGLLSLARPDWHSFADQDKDRGAKARVTLLDRLVSEQKTLVGFHMPQGGIGRVEKTADGGFRFVTA